MKQAVILAGGAGSRLRERLGRLPKPLVDICGMPLLERQILLVKKHGFTDILLLVHHGAEDIVGYARSKRNWGLGVECIDDGRPRGTAGAVLAAFDRLADEFLVLYGDTMLEVDLSRFHSFHRQAPEAAASLMIHPNDHPHDSDLVELDEHDRITAFHPYPRQASRYYPNLVNAALYWVNKPALAAWRQDTRPMDFGKDLFPDMLRRRRVLRGFNSPEYIKDIGTPSRLDRVCAHLRSGRIERACLSQPQAVVFADRDGTLNRDVDHLAGADQFELLPGVVEAIKRLNASDYRCCVVTNQPVVARGECSVEALRNIHNKLETLLGEAGAFVDRIYYCPHHPDRGFPGERRDLKIDCACRKPKTGMIDRAIHELNAAAASSWLVGDTSVDIETARRAGLRSILVETGYAGLDYRWWAMPDAIVPDFPAAVDFILDQYPRLLAQSLSIAREIGEGAIVLIGGQARSGKSTFASVLRDALKAQGKHAQILSIDRWLRSENDRHPGVMGRYDVPTLQRLSGALADSNRRPATLSLPGYHKLRRQRVEAVETIVLSPGDVILLEGTVALGLAPPGHAEAHRFHVETDEQVRRQRVLNEYRLRGLTESQALEVYLTRRNEEFPIIENMARSARKITIPPAKP